jgi:uncharacterized protein (TIGR02596 family)
MIPRFLVPSRLRVAFTLVETLVVVSIIVLILALTGPALLRSMQANKLTSAGDSLVGLLSEAQQMAVTLNSPVEVRFYKYTVAPDTFVSFRSYQLFKVSTPTAFSGGTVTFEELFVPLGQVFRLPENILIPDDADLSPVLNGTGFPDVSANNSNGYSGVPEAEYVALRFMTDGTCRRVTSVAGGSDEIATLSFQPLNQSYFTLSKGREIWPHDSRLITA